MFRDLKEYQEIAKIYAEKVSKPENLEERRGTELSKDQIDANRKGLANRIMYGNPEGKKPVSTSQSNRQKLTQQRQKQNKGRVEKQFGFLKPKPRNLKDGQTSVRQSGVNDPRRKKDTPIPSTDQIRKENPGVVPGTRVNEIGAEGGGKPSSGDLSMFKDKKPEPLTTKQKFDSKFIKKDKGSGFVKRGTPMAQRAENKEKAKLKAQAMAKARIAAKKEGTYEKPKTAQELAKERIAKKAAMEEYTPYDIVLEYLLSSEQAATIEEANYVMIEMDGVTINSIVKEFTE